MLRLFLILLSSLGMELADQATPMVREMQRNAPSQLIGIVRDADGSPVEGAAVYLMPNYYVPGSVTTDADGKYIINWKPSNYSWVQDEMYVIARDIGNNLAGSTSITVDSKVADITLAKGFSVKGKVVNEKSEPLEGARVSLSLMSNSWGCSFERTESKIKSDANGEFAVSCLPESHRYSINISSVKGYGSGNISCEADPGIIGRVIQLDNTILRIADMKISGQVVDEDGKGISNVNVYLYGSGQPNEGKQTDEEGKFTFEAVCSGRANIQANYQSNGRHLYNHIETEGGAEDVVLVVSEQPSYGGFVPRQPSSLLGKNLPDMTKYGITNLEAGKPVLLFFWDIQQRPSRYFIKQLAGKKEILETKGIHTVLVHNGQIDQEEIDKWLSDNSVPFESCILNKELDDAKFKLGLKGLPWLILADSELKVTAEGFTIDELEDQLK